MIPYKYIGDSATAAKFGLRIETKLRWQRRILPAARKFKHCTNGVDKSKARLFGISPEHAREYLVDEDGNQIGSGKMVFAVPAESDGPMVWRMFGATKYQYVFEAPAGTVYYSTHGTITPQKEVAFPYIIEPDDITNL